MGQTIQLSHKNEIIEVFKEHCPHCSFACSITCFGVFQMFDYFNFMGQTIVEFVLSQTEICFF